jgi:ferric-dicitrate binding protein FerR (iron transport regulator)
MDLNKPGMEITDDMLVSYLLDELSPDLKEQVNEWRKTPANGRRFDQFRIIWETSKNLKLTTPADAHASLQRLKEKAAVRNEEAKIIPISRSFAWLKIAAAILVLAGGIWLYFGLQKVEAVQFATTDVSKATTLPDGSVITLNKNTFLEYPAKFTGRQRKVKLAHGEAFFSVTHNRTMPFIIDAQGVSIKVVGTSFNVKEKNGDVEVIVETGLVQVSKNGSTIAVSPGESVLVKANASSLAKEKTPDHLYTWYRSKEFVADNIPLRRMVQVLNEAYDAHIIIARKELNDLPLNTTFKDETLDGILDIISRTFKITIEKKQDQIILK